MFRGYPNQEALSNNNNNNNNNQKLQQPQHEPLQPQQSQQPSAFPSRATKASEVSCHSSSYPSWTPQQLQQHQQQDGAGSLWNNRKRSSPSQTQMITSNNNADNNPLTPSLVFETAAMTLSSPPRKRVCLQKQQQQRQEQQPPSCFLDVAAARNSDTRFGLVDTATTDDRKPAAAKNGGKRDWWKIIPHPNQTKTASPKMRNAVCFVCQQALATKEENEESPSLSSSPSHVTRNDRTANTAIRHSSPPGVAAPKNTLYKYFTPKQPQLKTFSSQQPQQQIENTNSLSSSSTLSVCKTTTMTAITKDDAHVQNNNYKTAVKQHGSSCHFCQHALCRNCTLQCFLCQHNFCTICCRGTEQVQADAILHLVGGGGYEGHLTRGLFVCYDCVPQHCNLYLTTTTSHCQKEDEGGNSRMSIDD